MNKNKGITLIALIAYMILVLTVLAILTSMTRHFRRNLSFAYVGGYYELEFDKFLYDITGRTKVITYTVSQQSDTQITISNLLTTSGVSCTYRYSSADKTIYKDENFDNNTLNGSNIKVATNIDDCTFKVLEINGKKVIRVNMLIGGRRRIQDLTMRER